MNEILPLEQGLNTAVMGLAGLAVLLYLGHLVLRREGFRVAGAVTLVVASVACAGALTVRYLHMIRVDPHYFPLSNLFESALFMVFAVIVMALVVERMFRPVGFGLAASGLVTVIMALGSLLPPHLRGIKPLMPALQSYWLKIHVSLMMVSYAAFLISFLTAAIFLVFYYREKVARARGAAARPAVATAAAGLEGSGPALDAGELAPAGPMAVAAVGDAAAALPAAAGGAPALVPAAAGTRIPHVELLDEVTHRMILLGYPLLAFGIITGAIWANHAWGTYWSWDPKETWSLITWLVYSAYLHVRQTREWRGSHSAWFAVAGFVAVIITYLGVNYLPGSLHAYGSLSN